MKTNANDPIGWTMFKPTSTTKEGVDGYNPGLTKLEYLSAMAMQGFLSTYAGETSFPNPDTVAERAVLYAQALINELNKIEP